MTCDRCHKPIHPGARYDETAPDSASGAAPTIRTHVPLCRPVPHQSYPETRDARRRS